MVLAKLVLGFWKSLDEMAMENSERKMLNWYVDMSCKIKRLNFCRIAHFQRTGPHPLLVDFDLMASASCRIFFLIITRSHAKIASQGNMFGRIAGNASCWRKTAPGDVVAYRNDLGHANIRSVVVLRWPHSLSLELTTDFTLCMATWSVKSFQNSTGRVKKYLFHTLIDSTWRLPFAKHVKELCDGISNDTGDVFFHRHGCPRHGELVSGWTTFRKNQTCKNGSLRQNNL